MLGEGSPPIDFRTGAAEDVGALLRRCNLERLKVSNGGPQNHDAIGGAERSVRKVKESVAVCRLELGKSGFSIVGSLTAWESLGRYCVGMRSPHAKVEKTARSPQEIFGNTFAAVRDNSAMFCSRILAETPESVNSIGRFAAAAYLFPVRNLFAYFVVFVIEGELKFYQAKSFKYLNLSYPEELVSCFKHLEEG